MVGSVEVAGLGGTFDGYGRRWLRLINLSVVWSTPFAAFSEVIDASSIAAGSP